MSLSYDRYIACLEAPASCSQVKFDTEVDLELLTQLTIAATLAGLAVPGLYLIGRRLFVAAKNTYAKSMARALAQHTAVVRGFASKVTPSMNRFRSCGLLRARTDPPVLEVANLEEHVQQLDPLDTLFWKAPVRPDICPRTPESLAFSCQECAYDPVKGHFHRITEDPVKIKRYEQYLARKNAEELSWQVKKEGRVAAIMEQRRREGAHVPCITEPRHVPTARYSRETTQPSALKRRDMEVRRQGRRVTFGEPEIRDLYDLLPALAISNTVSRPRAPTPAWPQALTDDSIEELIDPDEMDTGEDMPVELDSDTDEFFRRNQPENPQRSEISPEELLFESWTRQREEHDKKFLEECKALRKDEAMWFLAANIIFVRHSLTTNSFNTEERLKQRVSHAEACIEARIDMLINMMNKHRIEILTEEHVEILQWNEYFNTFYFGCAKLAGTRHISDVSRDRLRNILSVLAQIGYRFRLALPLVNFMEVRPDNANALEIPADLQATIERNWVVLG
ncbi:uncharacterized protein BDZ99DRAFT_483097 [Mytilinidion resinicola]|uniref:Uncharacterized protein n=1 Tax=Mytilinidion resinicola TaxID=574789 RepID=A0A6A6XZS1_9PEZI|nr:uncharacterized protein BDZ99DRAFT_483097 [Mytilinidion resinicola]KAF2802066.1 hypothetical protein BDZ99DRAFT_483097 [Mytilinidion resinicola]